MKRIVYASLAVLVLAAPAILRGGGSPRSGLQSAEDTPADSLVGRWIEAVGGLDAYRQLRGARYTLTTELYDPETGRLRRTRPRYVTIAKTPAGEITRIERWEGDDFIAQGWDGETAWATLNGEELGPGDMDYDQVPYVSGDVHYWTGLPYKLLDPGVNLHYRGRQEDGRHLVTVSFGDGVGLHDGDSWRYWFRDGESWPDELAYREEGRDNWNVLSFQDIQTDGDYVFVGARVHVDDQGRVWKILRTTDFERNPGIDPAVFSEP